MKRILITGGAGFIGSNLVEYFNAHSPKTKIIVVDDLSTGLLENLTGLNCDFHHVSILDPERLMKSVAGVDTIIHLGAVGSVPRSIAKPMQSHDANATGTLNVLEAARLSRVAHVVVASSSSVYGGNQTLPKKEMDWTRPLSPYAASKLATEAYALAYQSSYGMKTLAFRLFNVYGPKQRADHNYAAVIPRFIDAALQGKPLTVHGDGSQSRDFTFVESVCSALYSSTEKQLYHLQPINLAFGTNTTLMTMIDVLRNKLQRPLDITYESSREGDVRSSQADSSTIRRLLPSVQTTEISVGIAKTIDWFLEKKGS